MSTISAAHWCYHCSRMVRAWAQDSIVCPDCNSGFLEEVSTTPPRLHRRSGIGDGSPFNPVIVLRGPGHGGGTDRFELFYDDGTGSGLRLLPTTMSEFLMGSGFDRLLDQLSQIEISTQTGRRFEHPPASKSAIESMPTIEISASHVGMDWQCAVCMEGFEIGMEAREMPCKHIYHKDCILPWLSLRNSCPICRQQMPAEQRGEGEGDEMEVDDRSRGRVNEEETVGLTIWRLPGGGFAVGRFSSSAGERQLPVVYTEMDGGFNSGGAPRRISWTERENSGQERRGIGRMFRNFLSLFGRRRFSSSYRTSPSFSPLNSDSESVIAGRRVRSRGLRFSSGLPSVRQ